MLQETLLIWKSCWIKTNGNKTLNLNVIRSYWKLYIIEYEVFNSTTTCICTNFPTNFNLMEIVLSRMPHDDFSIFKQIKN